MLTRGRLDFVTHFVTANIFQQFIQSSVACVQSWITWHFVLPKRRKKTLENPVIKMLEALNDILDMQEEHCTVCFCEYVCIFYNPEFL